MSRETENDVFKVDGDFPDTPDYETVEEAPDLNRDLLEVEVRLKSLEDVLEISQKVGISTEHKEKLTTQIDELREMHSKLTETLKPTTEAEYKEPVNVNPEDMTDLEMFTISRASAKPDQIPDQNLTATAAAATAEPEPEPLPEKEKRGFRDRLKSAKTAFFEVPTTTEKVKKRSDSAYSEEAIETQQKTAYQKPSYIREHENQLPETRLNVKTEGRGMFMTDQQLKDIFGDNYKSSQINKDKCGLFESRTHYFHKNLLIEESEDSISMVGKRKAKDMAVDLIKVAKAKGWESIKLSSGSPVFMEEAYVNAIKNGLIVEAKNLEQKEEFMAFHKKYGLESIMPFDGIKKEEIKPHKSEPMPEYQIERGRRMKM